MGTDTAPVDPPGARPQGRAGAGGTPDKALRAALAGVLVALVATAAVVRTGGAPTAALPPLGVDGDTVAVAVPTTETLASDPDATRTSAGCGFSVGAGASLAPVGSCTVLEIGDSLGNDLGWGLARENPTGSGMRLVQMDKSATGLANPGYYNWSAQLQSDLALYHPQLVLVCLGGNDQQGTDAGGSPVQFPTPAWQSAYLARVRQLLGEAAAGGASVMWVGLPIMQQPEYSQGAEVLNTLYQQAVRADPRALFVSSWTLFSTPQGAFQSTALVNGSSQVLRQPDGIHLSFAGENVIATYVMSEMASRYHVQLAPESPEVITGW